jgi:hypothetical protein
MGEKVRWGRKEEGRKGEGKVGSERYRYISTS